MTKNISIGKDKWIEWVDFDTANLSEYRIDTLLEPTQHLWKALETQCVIECCGIDALGLWKEDIEMSTRDMDKNYLRCHLSNLIEQLNEIEETVLISSLLNQLIDKSVFIQILTHIQISLFENEILTKDE